MRLSAKSRVFPGLMAMALILSLSNRAGAQAAAPTKIATVDPVRVFNELQKTKDLRVAMNAEGKQLDDERLARSGKLHDLQQQRDLLNPNAPQYQQLNQDLMKQTIEFQAWFQVHQLDLQRKQKIQINVLFGDITTAVGKVAEARGIDLVIAEQKPQLPENLDELQVAQLQALLSSRNVLYKKDAIDLSSAVIAQMDADYKSGK
ncbi:MAG TPA: OmpH family outer membrane protein [Tepidisphaeraceae bacterium]|nr:OmpH family outer membrane protein [Tepidisphaeraceae bacterium]